MQQQTWQPPGWWHTDRKGLSDDVYFENMSRMVFLTGLNWNLIDKKWPTIKRAFDGFKADRVARFTDKDVMRLLNDPGVIRNPVKIRAIIHNAQQILDIRKQYGSFRAYLDSLDKSDFGRLQRELNRRFKYLGPSTARMFLASVGEKVWHSD